MMTRTRVIRFFLPAALLISPFMSCTGSETGSSENADPDRREALFKQFEDTLTGAALVGYSTTGNGTLSEERYTIESVSHLKGDYWLFQARVQYGERDVTLPVPVQVKWAGDTPVITLTDLYLPGLGTFTARVLIFRGQYVGTWSSGDHGGQMFGRIEK